MHVDLAGCICTCVCVVKTSLVLDLVLTITKPAPRSTIFAAPGRARAVTRKGPAGLAPAMLTSEHERIMISLLPRTRNRW